MMLTSVPKKNGSMVNCAGQYLIRCSLFVYSELSVCRYYCPVEIILNSYHFFFLEVLQVVFFGCGCTGFSLAAESRGYSPVAVHGLLIVVASLLMEHGPYSTDSKAAARTGLVAPRYVESSWIRDQTHVSCIGGWFFTTEPPGKLQLSPFKGTGVFYTTEFYKCYTEDFDFAWFLHFMIEEI